MIVLSDLLLWAGLGGAGLWAIWVSRSQRELDLSHGLLVLLLTNALIVGAFFVQPGITNLHGVIATLVSLVFILAVSAWIGLRESVLKRFEWAIGACLAALWTFGALFQSRMHWERDPAASWNAAAAPAIGQHLLRSLVPIVAMVSSIALVSCLFRRGGETNWAALRNRFSSTGRRRWTTFLVVLSSFGLVNAAAFVGGDMHRLTVVGLQVSELSKPLWLACLVMIFVWWPDRIVRFRLVKVARPRDDQHPWVARAEWFKRQLAAYVPLFPLAVWLILIGGTAYLRNDYGSVIAPSLALAGMLLWSVQRNREQWRQAMGDPNRFHWRSAAVSIGLLMSVAALSSAVGKLRFRQWLCPWSLPWSIECKPVSVPELQTQVPEGYLPCASLKHELDLQQGSQMAKSQVAIDGGGLWGRGLPDIEAGIVGASDTDFILTATWSKFGATTVVLLVALTIIVGVLLLAMARRSPQTDVARGTALILSALGLMIAGQTVFVMMANANLLPHSGVPAPLLSFGTQSSVVLLLLLFGTLEAHRHTLPDATVRSKPNGVSDALKRFAELHWPMVILVVGLALAVLLGLLAPYRSVIPFGFDVGLRPGLPGVSEPVQTQRDSRTPVEVWVEGERNFDFYRGSKIWAEHQTESATLELADLAGLIRGADGQARALDVSITSLLKQLPPAAHSRWVPPDSDGVRLDLAIKPELQRTVQSLVTAQDEDGLRYPMGLVVLDPVTGAVLASASSPQPSSSVQQQAVTIEAPRGVVEDGRFVPLLEEECKSREDCGDLRLGYLDGDRFIALNREGCETRGDTCMVLQWEYAPNEESLDPDILASYTGRLPAEQVSPPAVGQDRVMNRAYGPASVFKVIVAAAYLRGGGAIDDRVLAPARLPVGGRDITNYYPDSVCPLTGIDGTMTVAEALAVSCNTPFVILARQIGWPAIAEMAEAFGFVADDAGEVGWPAASVIPTSVDSASLAMNVLGGGDVVATPLQLASVMATIANDGVMHRPVMFTSGTDVSGAQHTFTDEGDAVLTSDEAAALQKALALTAEVGTMAGLTERPLSGKTGTMALDAIDGRQYFGADLWYVGYTTVESTGERVAFALVAEVPPEYGAAQQHVRQLVGMLTEGIGGIN